MMLLVATTQFVENCETAPQRIKTKEEWHTPSGCVMAVSLWHMSSPGSRRKTARAVKWLHAQRGPALD